MIYIPMIIYLWFIIPTLSPTATQLFTNPCRTFASASLHLGLSVGWNHQKRRPFLKKEAVTKVTISLEVYKYSLYHKIFMWLYDIWEASQHKIASIELYNIIVYIIYIICKRSCLYFFACEVYMFLSVSAAHVAVRWPDYPEVPIGFDQSAHMGSFNWSG